MRASDPSTLPQPLPEREGSVTASAPAPPATRAFRGLVIIPAYNEADSIAGVVADLRQHAPDFDIVVIDDGSTDGTARCVPPPARVVSLPFNQGIGGAMQTGYRYAARHGYDVAVQVDGDGQHPAAELPGLVEFLRTSGADLAIGSRFLNKAGQDRSEAAAASGQPDPYLPPPSRMVGIRILRGLIRALTGERITDCTSGFRAAGPRAIAAFAHWYPDDYPEPEVVVLLDRAGFRVAEAPVRMAPRAGGVTSIPFTRGVFYVVKVSTALLLDTVRRPWPNAMRQR